MLTESRSKSFKAMEVQAKQGNIEAQFYLGLMYAEEVGVKNNFENAIYWLARAAEQGFPPAQFYLGGMYGKGEDVEQDSEKAFEWYVNNPPPTLC